jgi:hypothetical protein
MHKKRAPNPGKFNALSTPKQEQFIMASTTVQTQPHAQCTCIQSSHFRDLNHRETVDRLVDTLRDAEALLQLSRSVFGTIRDNLEGGHEADAIAQMVNLTYYVQRIIDGYEDKILRAWLGD